MLLAIKTYKTNQSTTTINETRLLTCTTNFDTDLQNRTSLLQTARHIEYNQQPKITTRSSRSNIIKSQLMSIDQKTTFFFLAIENSSLKIANSYWFYTAYK